MLSSHAEANPSFSRMISSSLRTDPSSIQDAGFCRSI
jgi:hypothetical protein